MTELTRIGIHLNKRQAERLRTVCDELGLPQVRLLVACIDVLDVHEFEAIIARYEPIRREDKRAVKAAATKPE